MGFEKCHLYFGCGVMKFFIISLCLLLLFDSPQGSSLPHKRCIRGLNTTLQTNFNGTYERINPCTNAEIETSSYIASHEFHHHTKEDTWGDYSQKCSAIISGFLQAIGNLIRFNNKQTGIFNFHINTSISQKQDGFCDSNKQKSCASLPTIVIEATGNEISPGSTTENPALKTERPWEGNAWEREYSFGGQPSTTGASTSFPPPAFCPSTLASQEPSIFDSDDRSSTPQYRTTAIPFEKTTPVCPSQPMEQNFEGLQNREISSTPVDVLPPAIQTSQSVPPFLAQFPSTGTAIPEQSSPAVFNEIPLNAPTTCEPEQKPDFYGTSPISTFNPDIPNGNTLRPEDESTTGFPTAYESSPANTLENPFTAVTYPEKSQPLKTISSSSFNEETEYDETLRTTPSQPFYYSTPDFRQQPVNNEEPLIQNQYQPSLIGGPQAQTVDPRQPFYDNLGGRVSESQQSANSFTPGEEMATGLPPNQFFQGPTAVDEPLGRPERIPPNLLRTGASPVQSVTGLDNVNSPNIYSSQPTQTPLSTPVPVEFPQSDANSFSLPPRSPGLISADSQNQASSTTARSEYDELSDQFYVTKPPQTDENLLNNARNIPEFPTSYTGPSFQPPSTMLPTDYVTNDYSTPFPEESPIPDQQTPRIPDATLGPQSGFATDIQTQQPNEPTIWYDNRPTISPPFPTEETYSNPNYNDFSSTVTTQRQDFLTPESQLKSPQPEQNLAEFNDRTLSTPDESPQASIGAEPFSPTVSNFAFTPKLELPSPGSTLDYNNEPVSRIFQAITTPKIQPPQSLTRSGFTTPEPEFSRVTPEQTRENVENEQYSSTTAVAQQQQTTASPDWRPPIENTNERGPEGLNDSAFNNQQIPNILNQPESQVSSVAPFDQFPTTFSPEQQPVGGYKIPRPTASFQSSERPEFPPSVDYPSDGITQMPDSTIYDQQTPNTFVQPEQQLTTSAPFGEIPKRFSPEPQYIASEYEDETMPTTEPSLGLSDSNVNYQQIPYTGVRPEPQLSSSPLINQFPVTLSPEQRPGGDYEVPQPSDSVTTGFQSSERPEFPPSVDYPSEGTTQMPDSTIYDQQTPNTFVQPQPQLTTSAPFEEIPKRFSPEPQYAAGSEYEDETMPTTEPSLGLSDSNVNYQQIPYTGANSIPEPQLSSSPLINQFPITLSPEQRPGGDYEVPQLPDSMTTESQPSERLEFSPSVDYPSEGTTQIPDSTIYDQQTPSTFVQPEQQLETSAPFEEIPKRFSPEPQYIASEYKDETMPTTRPEFQPSFGLPNYTDDHQKTQNAVVQPEPQLSDNAPSNKFLTTLSPEQQPLGNYEFPQPPFSIPVYEGETTPEPASQPSLDYANQYAYDRNTGTFPSTVINQQAPSSFVNPELQFSGNTPPSQFPSRETQSDNAFVEGSSPTEYPTSPDYDSTPEGFQPTLASSDTDDQPEPVTESPGPYYNPDFDFTTQTPFIDSIPTETYKNQSELRPEFSNSVQIRPDKFTTMLPPDFAATGQDYTTFPPSEPSTFAGYQDENSFSGLPPFAPSTAYPPQQSYVPAEESQMTSSSQPTVVPQAPFSSEQNSDGTSVQPSFSASEDSRESTQYSDIYSPTASNEYQTTQPTEFLDDSNKGASEIPGPNLVDRPSGSFTTPESYSTYGAEPAYAGTSTNTFIPETGPGGDSPNYSQFEQRPNTIGPYAVGDFSRGNQRGFSSRPFLQDKNEKFQGGQPLNLQSGNPFDSARNGYETAYPEQTSQTGQFSYERFPTATPITPTTQELSTAPTPTQWQPEDSFASSNQPSGYGTMLSASDRRIVENSPTTSPTPFVDLNKGQSEQEPNQPPEYPNEGLTNLSNPTTFEPAVYEASPPQTITPVYDERPYPTLAESTESPALLPEETQPSFIPGTSFAPPSEPQDQENLPTKELYNYDQTEQYPGVTPPVQQLSIEDPMNYQPGSFVQPRITQQSPAGENQTSEQPPYLPTGTTAFPSNGYDKDLTPMEYGSINGRTFPTTTFPSEPQQNDYGIGPIPMEYEPNNRQTSPTPVSPSGPQPNEYNKYITPNEYQSTALPAAVAEGPNYPNEMSDFNTSPENSVTFPPVGSQSSAPQFIPGESPTGSFVTDQPADSPKTQTDAYVSYSQTQSTSELEPQSLISTVGNDQPLPSFRPSYFPEKQTETTSPYLNDRSGGFGSAFAVTEQIPSDTPLKTTPSMLTENQTIKPTDFRSLDSTFTEPENAVPFYGTSDASVPTVPPIFQYGPNQQQPTFDRPLSVPPNADYNQFPSTVSSQFTPTRGEEPIVATPSQPPKPRMFSQPSPEYYTDVPGFERNSENEQSLSTFDAGQNIEPRPQDGFTDLSNYTPETNAPTGEYPDRAFTPKANIPLRYSEEAPFAASESSPAPVPQDTPIPQQNSFTQDVPMDSTPFAPEPQPENSFDYTTEIPDYKTTDSQTIDSSSPFQPEPFDTNFSVVTPQQTYTNAPDNINTRPDFSLPEIQPEPQQYDRESNPNVNVPTSTLGYAPTNNQPDLAFGSQEPITDGVTSPYPPNPTTASYQTFPSPATQPAEAMIDSNNEPINSFNEPSETLQAQESSDTPSGFRPSTLLPEFGSTPVMNDQQFSPFSEIPDTRYQTISESQSTTFSEMQNLGPIDSPRQYTTPRQQTDYPPPFTSPPQDQVPNIPSNNQEETQPTDQLIQGDLPSSPAFYDQYSSTVPPEYLNIEPVATSEYPTPEPVLNYPPKISNPEWETTQTEQPQPNMDGRPIMSYDQPSTLFTDRPDTEMLGEIVPTTPEPQLVGYTNRMQDGEYSENEPEMSPNPQGYPGPTPEPLSGSNLNGELQSDSFVGFPSSFQQTTPSEFSPQTQTPPFETYSNGERGLTGPVTEPLPSPATNQATNFPTQKQTKTVEEILITEFPVTDSSTETQLPYTDKILSTDDDLLDVSPQGVTTPQPYDFTESSSYPDPLTRYNVRQRPDRQLALGGTTTPLYSENKNDQKAGGPTERPELDQQRFALGNPVSPDYADYNQGFSTRPPTLTEFDDTPSRLTPGVTAPTDRPQFVTEGSNDQQLGKTAQRETDSPLGFGFEERSPPNSELPIYPPPQQDRHSNPLLQALETQMPLPLQNHLQHVASSFPEPLSLNPRGTSPIPFSFESQNQNDVPIVPPYYPEGGLERNFGTSQPVVNTARDVMNTPLPDSQALVPDLPSTPSNKPDRPTTGRFGYMSSSLRNPYMRSIG